MRKMLVYNPKKRISFADALKFWYPASTVFSDHPLNEEDSPTTIDPYPLGEGMKEESSAECHSPALAVSASSVPPPDEGGTQVANPDECHSLVPSAVESAEPPRAALPASEPPVPPSLPPVPSSATSARSRLSLKRPDGPAGHNKTRRSPRNSGRSPAIGNRGTRVRG